MNAFRPDGAIGRATPRIEGAAKVTGRARYGADQPVAGALFAALATSAIARGRIVAIDQSGLARIAGIRMVLTHANVGKAVKPGRWFLNGGAMSTTAAPLAGPQVRYAGQIVAVVVADSFEAARDGAAALRFTYAEEAPAASFDSPGAREVKPRGLNPTTLDHGDVDAALAAAAHSLTLDYETPAQHHNPLELFQTTCAWRDGRLEVWESSQSVRSQKFGLAKQLGISPSRVEVHSPLAGGAFGSRGDLSQVTALVALAAKRLARPVKYVGSRRQGFTTRTFRAETRHKLRIACDAAGKLTGIEHLSWELVSRTEAFTLAGADTTSRLYAIPAIRIRAHAVEADRQTPGFMRAPPEVPFAFAMESALDELAHTAGIDPVALRLANDTNVDPVNGKPFVTRGLAACLRAGAKAIGWDRRSSTPGAVRGGGDYVGLGCASAFYAAQIGPADAEVTLMSDGRARVRVGTHEIGQGAATLVAQVAADRLGLAAAEVDVEVGDSELPPTILQGGSTGAASAGNAVLMAAEAIRARLVQAAVAGPGPLGGADPAEIRFRDGMLVAGNRAERVADLAAAVGGGKPIVQRSTHLPARVPPGLGPMLMRRGIPVMLGGHRMFRKRLGYSFGAQFVEVRVDAVTGEVRVSRMVGAFAAGRIINPVTARAQLTGGMIWGVSAALHEATEIDPRTARYVNADFGEYHIPVHADVPQVEAMLIDEDDPTLNPLGIKGVGELGIVGMNAAVANAVFNATGRRVRRLPIRPEDVI